jgi:hypothetical protein
VALRSTHSSRSSKQMELTMSPSLRCSPERESSFVYGEHHGYGLEANLMRWFLEQYAPGISPKDPDMAPVRIQNIPALPPAPVTSAESRSVSMPVRNNNRTSSSIKVVILSGAKRSRKDLRFSSVSCTPGIGNYGVYFRLGRLVGSGSPEVAFLLSHSVRSARMGSMEAARRAGR